MKALTRLLPIVAAAAFAVACSPTNDNPYATSTATASAGAAGAVTVTETDYAINPASVTVKSGDSITVMNKGQAPHNLWVRDAAGKIVAKSAEIKPGASVTFSIPGPAGEYVMYCQEPGHEALGMKGKLTVS